MDNSKMKQYSIKSESNGFQAISTTQSNYTVKTDMPQKFGGQGDGPSPIEYLLASLVGCENITAQGVSKSLGFTISKASYDIKAERDERGVNTLPLTDEAPVTAGLSRIWGTVFVETDGTNEQLNQLNQILKKRCPVARMIVDSGCKLEVEWKKLD